MRINLIEHNNPTFFLDFINDNEVKSYQDINNLLDTYQESCERVKKELQGLIMARPSDIFTYSDEEGTVLEQLNEKEEQLLENLAYYTHILEDVTLLKNYIDDYVMENISDEMFDEFKNYNDNKFKTKEDLVFDMVVHPDKYEICKKFQNVNDPLVPLEKSINNIIEHALFNINKNNYNVCPTIQGKKENNNVKYIIYIRDKKNNFIPYINKNNNIMFDIYKEAEERRLLILNEMQKIKDYCWTVSELAREFYGKDFAPKNYAAVNDSLKALLKLGVVEEIRDQHKRMFKFVKNLD